MKLRSSISSKLDSASMKYAIGVERAWATANTSRSRASGKRESYVRLNITKLKWKFRDELRDMPCDTCILQGIKLSPLTEYSI